MHAKFVTDNVISESLNNIKFSFLSLLAEFIMTVDKLGLPNTKIFTKN